jgi:mannose-1-phosphate guanylyltransferase
MNHLLHLIQVGRHFDLPSIGYKRFLEPLCLGNAQSVGSQHIVCVASEGHRFLVSDALSEGVSQSIRRTVLLEPVGKNTAAAMAIAASRPFSERVFLAAT